MEVIQALSLLALVVMDNAKSRILKNGNVAVVQERAISQTEGNGGEMWEFYRFISRDVPESQKGNK